MISKHFKPLAEDSLLSLGIWRAQLNNKIIYLSYEEACRVVPHSRWLIVVFSLSSPYDCIARREELTYADMESYMKVAGYI